MRIEGVGQIVFARLISTDPERLDQAHLLHSTISQIRQSLAMNSDHLGGSGLAFLRGYDELLRLRNSPTERYLQSARYRVRTCDPYRVKVVLYH